MGYTIEFNHESKFVCHVHKGVIERKEIGELWRELLNMDVFTKNGYNLLSDYRDGMLNFDTTDLDYIEDFLNSIRNVIKGKRNAVIVNSPHDAVISMLFEYDRAKKLGFHVKTFSTEDAAIKFLKGG